MSLLLKNWKTYIIIDFNNGIYGFVNSPADINSFYSDLNINIATLPRDVNNILIDVILVKMRTKEEFPVKFSSGNTLCI
jgi:hypothetical protein